MQKMFILGNLTYRNKNSYVQLLVYNYLWGKYGLYFILKKDYRCDHNHNFKENQVFNTNVWSIQIVKFRTAIGSDSYVLYCSQSVDIKTLTNSSEKRDHHWDVTDKFMQQIIRFLTTSGIAWNHGLMIILFHFIYIYKLCNKLIQ
jgi:hypothetical protein